MGVLTLIGQLIYFFLPAGVANMSPVLFKNKLRWLARPVDGGRQLGGRPIFGSHKTWRGLIVAPIMAEALFLIERFAALQWESTISWSVFNLTEIPWWFGFALGAGAILGDLIKSFFKRRVSVAPGKSWFPFDQLDFLIGAGLVTMLVAELTSGMWLTIILLGPFLHIAVNRVGFWLKLKDTPW